ncbi:hypothetical protein [Nostoc sp.]
MKLVKNLGIATASAVIGLTAVGASSPTQTVIPSRVHDISLDELVLT